MYVSRWQIFLSWNHLLSYCITHLVVVPIDEVVPRKVHFCKESTAEMSVVESSLLYKVIGFVGEKSSSVHWTNDVEALNPSDKHVQDLNCTFVIYLIAYAYKDHGRKECIKCISVTNDVSSNGHVIWQSCAMKSILQWIVHCRNISYGTTSLWTSYYTFDTEYHKWCSILCL